MTDTNGADLSAAEDFATFEARTSAPPAEAARPAPEAAPEGGEPQTEEVLADEPTEGQGDGPKPKKTVQQRFDELTWKAREAERREKETSERYEKLLRGEGPAPNSAPAPQTQGTDENPPPNPEDYEFGDTDAQFIRDLAQHETRSVIAAERQADERNRTIATALQGFNTRLTEQFPDGPSEAHKAFFAAQNKPSLLQFITMDSEHGPKLAEHYGSNPAELERLAAMPAHLQGYEIGKGEARFATATADPAKLTTKRVTDAPEPAPRARGAGGQFKVDGNTESFADFEKQYGR